MKRVERLHAISEMLQRRGARGCTAERLASEFGVSVRTIKRDLDSLESSGTPIWSRPGPGGGYGLAQGSMPPISLSPAQAVSLLAAVSAAPDAPYADLALVEVRKILDVLDPLTREHVQQLANRVWVDRPTSPPKRVRSVIEQGMTDQRVLRIEYISGEGTTTLREVEPILFGSTTGRWYLMGWCQLRDAIRWFRLDRIQKATMTSIKCTHTIDEVGTPPATAQPVLDQDDW